VRISSESVIDASTGLPLLIAGENFCRWKLFSDSLMKRGSPEIHPSP
jgi:hypothetical protein